MSFASRGILDVAGANLNAKKLHEVVVTPPVPANAKVTSITARCIEPLGDHVQVALSMNGMLHLIKISDKDKQKPLKVNQLVSLKLGLPRRTYTGLMVMNKLPQGELAGGKVEIMFSYHFPFAKNAAAHLPFAQAAEMARREVRDQSLRSHVATPDVMVAAEQAAQHAMKRVVVQKAANVKRK